MKQNNPEITPDTFELIEQYLLDQMNEEERKVFEDRLEKEKILKNELDLQRSLVAAIEAASFFEEKNNLAPIKTIKESTPLLKRQSWLIAACIIFVIATTAWWFLALSSSEKTYNAYFIPDPGLPTNMGGVDNYHFERGMVDYKQKAYEAAINRWEPLLKNDPANDTLNYFLGVARLNKNDLGGAMPYLQKVKKQPTSLFHNPAIWYLALIQINHGDNQKAIELLQQIPDYPDADELLKELNKK